MGCCSNQNAQQLMLSRSTCAVTMDLRLCPACHQALREAPGDDDKRAASPHDGRDVG